MGLMKMHQNHPECDSMLGLVRRFESYFPAISVSRTNRWHSMHVIVRLT